MLKWGGQMSENTESGGNSSNAHVTKQTKQTELNTLLRKRMSHIEEEMPESKVNELLKEIKTKQHEYWAAVNGSNLAQLELYLWSSRVSEENSLSGDWAGREFSLAQLGQTRGAMCTFLKDQAKVFIDRCVYLRRCQYEMMMAACKARVLRENHPSKLTAEISGPCSVHIVCIDLYSGGIFTVEDGVSVVEIALGGGIPRSFCCRVASRLARLLYDPRAGRYYEFGDIYDYLKSFCTPTGSPEVSVENNGVPIIGLYKLWEGMYALFLCATETNVRGMIRANLEDAGDFKVGVTKQLPESVFNTPLHAELEKLFPLAFNLMPLV